MDAGNSHTPERWTFPPSLFSIHYNDDTRCLNPLHANKAFEVLRLLGKRHTSCDRDSSFTPTRADLRPGLADQTAGLGGPAA